jgi:hypothetical protein
MTSRERVISTIEHREPDRVPLDIGSSVMSGIMGHALDRLRKHLNLEKRPVKFYEIFQMLGEVETDIIERFHLDVLPVEPKELFFGIRRENYKPWKLFDGTDVLVPGQFDVEVDDAGNWLLHHEGEITKPVEAKMPKDGFYFDMPSMSETHMDFVPPPLSEAKDKGIISVEDLEFMQARAEHLRKTTDKALFLGCWGALGLKSVGSIPDFLMLLMTDKDYVRDLFEIGTEVALRNLENLKTYLGDLVDIVGIDGSDYGGQENELFPPELFEELYVPQFKIRNDWIHEHTGWKTWLHTCGSNTRIIPLLIKGGIDIVNPVQTSARGMDAMWLKKEFGDKITFWGGGIDTQKTLPFSAPEDVRREVKERIDIFAPGGGFVFNTIHNIQQNTPPENIVAAYDTAYEYGKYPIKGE